MAHLIDKDAVLAEIDRMFNKHSSKHDIDEAGVVLLQLRDNIESTKVTDVDLEKEIGIFFGDADWKDGALKEEQKDMIEFAKHFFVLGLKVQNKITPLQQQRISVMKMEFWTGLQTFNESEMTLSDAYNKGIEDVLEELGLKAQKGE